MHSIFHVFSSVTNLQLMTSSITQHDLFNSGRDLINNNPFHEALHTVLETPEFNDLEGCPNTLGNIVYILREREEHKMNEALKGTVAVLSSFPLIYFYCMEEENCSMSVLLNIWCV